MNNIDIHKAKEMIEVNKPVIIDIRHKDDFAAARIKDAIWVGDENIDGFLNSVDKSSALICYCYHGISSQQAAQFFESSGFKEVYSVEGGFEAWRANYSVEEN